MISDLIAGSALILLLPIVGIGLIIGKLIKIVVVAFKDKNGNGIIDEDE